MDGIEIVITPRIIERAIYGTIIVILLALVVFNMGGEKCVVPEKATAAVVAAAPNLTNKTSLSLDTVPVAADACTNKVKDAGETDIDCGGDCEGCQEFQGCNVDADCTKETYCFQHIKCMKATCDDGVKNQDETDVDCGGVCGGYFWKSDSKCHNTTEPSGKFNAQVEVEYTESELSENVVLSSVTLRLENGLSRNLGLKAYIYALDDSGDSVFEDRNGDPVAIETVNLPSIASGDKYTKEVDLTDSTRATLPGVKSSDEFQISVTFKDADNKELDTITWTNN